jgi:hypothetical protein
VWSCFKFTHTHLCGRNARWPYFRPRGSLMKDYIRNDEGTRAMVPDAARGRVRDETAARWGARARLFTRLKRGAPVGAGCSQRPKGDGPVTAGGRARKRCLLTEGPSPGPAPREDLVHVGGGRPSRGLHEGVDAMLSSVLACGGPARVPPELSSSCATTAGQHAWSSPWAHEWAHSELPCRSGRSSILGQ